MHYLGFTSAYVPRNAFYRLLLFELIYYFVLKKEAVLQKKLIIIDHYICHMSYQSHLTYIFSLMSMYAGS